MKAKVKLSWSLVTLLEFLTYFPQWKEQFISLRSQYDLLCSTIDTVYHKIKGTKGFMKTAKSHAFGDVLNDMHMKNQSVQKVLSGLPIKRLEEILATQTL
jgi:hypothetical protein